MTTYTATLTPTEDVMTLTTWTVVAPSLKEATWDAMTTVTDEVRAERGGATVEYTEIVAGRAVANLRVDGYIADTVTITVGA